MAISTTHDIVPDSPTNTFATLNPLTISTATLSDGNLKSVVGNAGTKSLSTISFKSGKYFCEVVFTSITGDGCIGITKLPADNSHVGFDSDSYGYVANGGKRNTSSTTSYGDGWGVNDVIGIYFDDGDLYFTKNGVLQNSGTPAFSLGTTNTYAFAFGDNSAGASSTLIANFGQDPTFGGATGLPTAPSGSPFTDAKGIGKFYYDPPTGALALCTANLPDPDIDPAVDDLPEDYFKAVIWSGTGGARTLPDSNSTPNSMSFNADLIWIKARNQSYNHTLFDSVRGFGKKHLFSDLTSGESANEYGHVSSITGNQFSVANGTGGDTYTNNSSTTYCAWCWKAGGAPSGSTSTTGSAKRINTSGTQDDTSCSALASAASATITPTLMSINQKAGFSIVKYTGSNSTISVPHGLSSAPEMIIWKALGSPNGSDRSWLVWTKDLLSSNHYLYLNENYNQTLLTSGSVLTNLPNSNSFSLGTEPTVNWASENYIAYCWHSVAGYSKFGSYTGNGSPDGPFVYTGFRPAFVMIKNIDVSSAWSIFDSARDESNVVGRWLAANLSNEEQDLRSSHYPLDFLSNGFKLRTDLLTGTTNINLSNIYIFMAFAEQPFKFSNAR